MIPDLLDDLADRVMRRFFGKYRGEVIDVDDPEKMGRLKVRTPAVLGDAAIWAMPCVPYAGDAVGFYVLPKVGAGVWVEFEAGDPTYPIWVGCFWRSGELPSEASAPTTRLWRTEKATIKLDDDADEIEIANSQGPTLIFDAALTGKVSQASVEIASAGVTVATGGVGKIEATTSSVSVNAGGLEVS